MYRSCILALAAVAAIGSSCLVTTDAFARGGHGGGPVHAPPTHTVNLGHSTFTRPWTRPWTRPTMAPASTWAGLAVVGPCRQHRCSGPGNASGSANGAYPPVAAVGGNASGNYPVAWRVRWPSPAHRPSWTWQNPLARGDNVLLSTYGRPKFPPSNPTSGVNNFTDYGISGTRQPPPQDGVKCYHSGNTCIVSNDPSRTCDLLSQPAGSDDKGDFTCVPTPGPALPPLTPPWANDDPNNDRRGAKCYVDSNGQCKGYEDSNNTCDLDTQASGSDNQGRFVCTPNPQVTGIPNGGPNGGFQCLEENAQVNHDGTTTCQNFSYWGDGSSQPCKMGSSADTSSAFGWTCVAPTEAQWQGMCVQSFDEIPATGTQLLALAQSCAGHFDGLTSFREFCSGPVSEPWIQDVQQQVCSPASASRSRNNNG